MRDGYAVSWDRTKNNKDIIYAIYDPVGEKIRYARKSDIIAKGLADSLGIEVETNRSFGSSIEIPHTSKASVGATDYKILTMVYKTGDTMGVVDNKGQVYLCKFSDVDLIFASSRINGFSSSAEDEEYQPIGSITKKVKYININTREVSDEKKENDTSLEPHVKKSRVSISEVSNIETSKKQIKEDKTKTVEKKVEAVTKEEIEEKVEVKTENWYDVPLLKKWIEHSETLDSITMSRKIKDDLSISTIKVVASMNDMSRTVEVARIGIGESKNILASIRRDVVEDTIKIVKLSKYRVAKEEPREIIAATEICKRIWQQ